MRTMTCKQLGGACELQFNANNFEEIAEMSKKHGMEMYKKGDEAHINAMNKMMLLMKNPQEMNNWFESKRKEFDEMPEFD